MIVFTDRNFKTIALTDTKDVILLDDELNENIETGTSIFKATFSKKSPDIDKIQVGQFVFISDYKPKPVVFEIMEVIENRSSKEIIAEDAGLDLLNSDAPAINMKGTLEEFLAVILGADSGWQIGLNEVPDKNITLDYTEIATQTKRITQVAKRFGCEVFYTVEMQGNNIKRKLINFSQKRGKNIGERLELENGLQDITRHVSITELCTAVKPIGRIPEEELVEEKTPVPEMVNQISETTNAVTTTVIGKVEKMIQWFKEREGKVGYSQTARLGPNSYDCSSSVLIAAKHAGLIPESTTIGNTATMWSWGTAGTHFTEISKSNIKRGDIFVSRYNGAGHTGVILDNNTIIHCTVSGSKKGIMTTNLEGWTGTNPKYFRWNDATAYNSTTTVDGGSIYWSHSKVVHHDLAKVLKGLTASNLDNWIKAKSPNSPFVGQGSVFIEAEKQSKLDARIILAHAAHESAWGTSRIAKSYHNYFGIMAYDSNPDNASNFSSNSLSEGIIKGAKWIKEKYYDVGQNTLYKMRFNNGTHEYATDPEWANKIANIAVGSHAYCKPMTTPTTQSPVTSDTSTVTSEERVNITLEGYDYDDGRFFVNGKGEICDRVSAEMWNRFDNKKNDYILRIYESEAGSQKTLFDEGKRFLENNNTPKIDYEVNLSYLPDSLNIGDTVRIIDHEYNPPLYLEARLIDVTRSFTNKHLNKAVFSNFVERKSGVDLKLLELESLAKYLAWKFEDQPFIMDITSTNGDIFKDGAVDTILQANITRAGISQSSVIDGFKWERVSEYQDKVEIPDAEWNENHELVADAYLEIGTDDVDLQATFTCSAFYKGVVVATASYTIKDLTIGIYNQLEEPTNPKWGDLWQFDDGEIQFRKIWKGDAWEDVVSWKDLEEIELLPGEKGEKGEKGDKGDDGEVNIDIVTGLEERQQTLEVLFQLFPDPEEIKTSITDLEKLRGYAEALQNAIESDALTLEERLSIIEANVGAGKLEIQAINTYLNFGEEGILIGRQNEQVKMRLINDALEILDGTKVVARFGNNQVEVPNLRVSGVLEFGYHIITKTINNGNKCTLIRPM